MTPTEFAVKTLYWFFLYGFIGWGVEVVYAAVKTHKLVNRGFLCGPICPIYGFGMVGLIYSVSLIPMPDSGSMSAVAIFFIGMILTTAIELVGGWALFKIYHIRWWDYSNMKFNLGGYICPQFSLLWGLGSVLMIKVIHPLLARGSSPMPFNIMLIVDVVLLVLFVVDVAASTAAAIGLNKYLREIDELRAKLRVQLLLTAPVSVTAVVLGKYFAMLTVFAVPVAIACLCPLIIALNGTAFLLADYGAILAFFLLGALVECGPTSEIFSTPKDKRTEDYISGRFG